MTYLNPSHLILISNGEESDWASMIDLTIVLLSTRSGSRGPVSFYLLMGFLTILSLKTRWMLVDDLQRIRGGRYVRCFKNFTEGAKDKKLKCAILSEVSPNLVHSIH